MTWPQLQLRRIFRIVNGGTPTSDEQYWNGSVPWATPVDVGHVDGGYLVSTQRSLTREGVLAGSRTVADDALILSTRAPIGYIAQTTETMAFNQGCRGLVATIPADVRYFRYQLLALRGDLVSRGAGSTFMELSSDALAAVPVTCPPLDEQWRIANFLDAETARMDALSDTYETTKTTIDERVQRLIDLQVDSAGDLVPLKYCVRFREGPGIMAVDFRDEGTPLIRISGLRDGMVTLNGANFLDEDAVAARWSQFRLRLGDYIISGSATMGAVSMVKDPAVVGAIPYTGLIILRPARPDVVMEYVAAVLSSSMFLRQIDLLKAGATMQHFGPTHLAQVSIPLPVQKRQESIASTVSDVREQASKTTAAIDRQIALLAERRQALITAAVAGRITV